MLKTGMIKVRVILCGCDSWTALKQHERKTETAEKKCLMLDEG